MLPIVREVKPISHGFVSRSTVLGLAAHGYSPEVADLNLVRLVKLFFMPFRRAGTLKAELSALGFELDDFDGIQLEDHQ